MGRKKNLLVAGFGITVAGLFSMTTTAAEDWKSEVELGAVMTTGNADEQNFKFRFDSIGDLETVRHTAHVDTLKSSKDSNTTAQKAYLSYQLDYKLEGDRSVFGRVAYEDDRFSGYDYQVDATVGYSQLLFENNTMKLTGDAGLGYRTSELETGGSEDEMIVRLAAKYLWQVSENATFQQLLSAEIGSDSTISRSDTSLKTTIVGDLAMKLALSVKHNSEVPAGRENTDTETSVTLVYAF